MKTSILSRIQSLRSVIHQLRDDTTLPYDDEQTEDITHMLSAVDLLEERFSSLDHPFQTNIDPMPILHELITPLGGIIGYLFILQQEYTSPLSKTQRLLVSSIERQTHQLHLLIRTHLLTRPTNP